VCADALPVQTRALQSLVRRRRISRDERDLFLAQARDERRDLGEIVLREKRDVSVADWMEALRLAERPSNRKWIVAAVVGAILAIGALVLLRQRG